MKFLILGNGPSAVTAAETLRTHDANAEITLLSREQADFYSPCPLAEYVEGTVARQQLFLRDPDFYHRNRFKVLLGSAAQQINAAAQQVSTTDGKTLAYDRLLIATGAEATLPPLPGLATTPGVYTLKTLNDADQILQHLPAAKQAVVIGAGFIGLEATQALTRRGLEVTLLEAQPHVLPTMLDAEVAAKVAQRLADHHVQVRLNQKAQSFKRTSAGITGLILNDGTELPCQLLVCATGVRPDLALLDGSGIEHNRGVLVDAHMQTNLSTVYAAGDVIEFAPGQPPFRTLPNWPNAVTTGRIAACNMLGLPRRHSGLWAVNAVRVFGQAIASFGSAVGEQAWVWRGPAGSIRKVWLHDNRICGGQFLGDIRGAGMLLHLMHKGLAVHHFGPQLAGPSFHYLNLHTAEAFAPWD